MWNDKTQFYCFHIYVAWCCLCSKGREIIIRCDKKAVLTTSCIKDIRLGSNRYQQVKALQNWRLIARYRVLMSEFQCNLPAPRYAWFYPSPMFGRSRPSYGRSAGWAGLLNIETKLARTADYVFKPSQQCITVLPRTCWSLPDDSSELLPSLQTHRQE